MAKRTEPMVYQLKVTLRGSKPPIWRRLLMRSDATLADLHVVLQIAMGWTESHLHAFQAVEKPSAKRGFWTRPELYSDPVFELEEAEDESRYQLHQVFRGEKAKMMYQYDFGDGWDHDLVLEKILPLDPGQGYPQCVKGKGACPPEDCGGLWGYYHLLEVLADPSHREHEEMREWVSGPIDPDAFDLEAVNQHLRALAKPRQRRD